MHPEVLILTQAADEVRGQHESTLVPRSVDDDVIRFEKLLVTRPDIALEQGAHITLFR